LQINRYSLVYHQTNSQDSPSKQDMPDVRGKNQEEKSKFPRSE